MSGKVDFTKVPDSVPLNPTSGSNTPSTFQNFKAGVGSAGNSLTSAAASVSEWQAVKTVRGSTAWSYITWPLSVVSSFFSGIWDRISKAYWGHPRAVTTEISLEFPGRFWTSTIKTSPETALSKGWLTIEEGVARSYFTLDQAQINGWVPVTIPGKWYGSSTMMLKTAIERSLMTVEKAIEDKHITESQAKQADWIVQKKTT